MTSPKMDDNGLTREQEIREAVARGWCDPANSHKEMDVILAESIVREVLALRQDSSGGDSDDPVIRATLSGAEGRFDLALNVRHPKCHAAADAFWKYWRENGETGKHGYYESTWGAINAALRLVGVRTYNYPSASLKINAAEQVSSRTQTPDEGKRPASAAPEPIHALDIHRAHARGLAEGLGMACAEVIWIVPRGQTGLRARLLSAIRAKIKLAKGE